MFAAFPSDYATYQTSPTRSGDNGNALPLRGMLPPGSVSNYRQRTAEGSFHFGGETLPYPASLPTSGINPQIVEYRRGPPVGERSSSSAVAVSHVDISSASLPLSVNSVSAQQPVAAARPPTPLRELVVPILDAWEGQPSTVFRKPVVERVAFKFAQDALSAPLPDDVCREVLLKDQGAFDEWMKLQVKLQHWRWQEGVTLAKKNEKERERYAREKRKKIQAEAAQRGESEGDMVQTVTRAYKRKKPLSGKENRTLYLCDHAGKPEPKKGKGKQLVTKPSIKVGCKARLVVYQLDDKSFRVVVEGRHTEHDPRSEDSITESRMPLGVREWIQERVEEGLMAQAIYNHIALGEAAMEDYESSDSDASSDGEESEAATGAQAVPRPMLYNFKVNIDYIRARIRLHNATKVRPTNLNGEKLADVEACGALLSEIKATGGWSVSCLRESPDGPVDVIAFATKWQIKILKKYGGIVMMDATHNVTKGLNGNKAYLYTLIVKNKKVNRGTPVAFLMTESGSQYPIELFLRKLFSDPDAPCVKRKPHTFIIDCSRTEHAAITLAVPGANILYCHYHFWKAINSNLDSKVGKGTNNSVMKSQVQSARVLIQSMVRAPTEAQFNEAWNQAQVEWGSQGPKWKTFMAYFVRQWHYQAEEWAGYSRRYEHGGIDTNNYLESWHQKLKKNHMKKRNLNMPQVIAMLFREILPLFRFAHLRVARGFAEASLTTAERRNRTRAMEYTDDDVIACVEVLEAGAQIRVRSMQDQRAFYTISFAAGKNTLPPLACTCQSYQRTHDKCKHMFLVLRYTMMFPPSPAHVDVDDERPIPGSPIVEDLRDALEGDAASVTGSSVHLAVSMPPLGTQLASVAMAQPTNDATHQDGDSPDVDDDNPDDVPDFRLQSSSPPPLHVTQRQDQRDREVRALHAQWKELAASVYRKSLSSELTPRHDPERMRNMVAQLQTMLSTWPEAIGQRDPGAAQNR